MSEAKLSTVKWVLAVGLLAGALAVLAAGSASATQSGSTYVSGSGDWLVTTPTQVQNEAVDVNGNLVITSTMDMMNVTIRFTAPGKGIQILAPAGGLVAQPGAGGTLLFTASDDNNYWTFTIQNTTSNVDIQNATIDRILNGVNITGGTAQSRYFAHITVTHAKFFGWQLTDSFATLYNINTTLDFASGVTRRDWDNRNYVANKAGTSACSSNQSFNGTTNTVVGPGYYGYKYRYRCINDFWSATGTGYSVTRGGPSFDGIDVHIPSGLQRVDAVLMGSYDGWYNYSYYYNTPCYQSGQYPTHYWYEWNYTYHYFQAFLSFNGTIAQDTQFARFKDVHPPPEDIFLDLHYNLVGIYQYYYDYCGYSAYQSYSYPDYVYSWNRIDVVAADVVGIKVTNGNLGDNFNGLNLSMGRAGAQFTSDWGGSVTYQQYFLQSYATFALPNLYAFWSAEFYTIASAQAVTRTDFTLRNSIATGAGVRFDRMYNYTPSGVGVDTIFRGVVTIDNITVRGVTGLGLDVRIIANASNSFDRNEYTATISNSYFSAYRAFALNLTNQLWYNSNYTANIVIQNNTFRDGNVTPPSFPSTGSNTQPPIFGGAVAVDTGYHHTGLAGDWYQANVTLRDNTFFNISGTVFGWSYSDYQYPGSSNLVFENNVFRQISYWTIPQQGGGMTPPHQADAMIKTIADNIVFRGNTFDNVAVNFGLLGGFVGPSATVHYYSFVICQYYIPTYGYHYWLYGCSFPMKTPTILVEGNNFNAISTFVGGQRDAAFFALPGHAKMTFNNNTVTDSKAIFINAFLYFYTTTYQFLNADLDVRIQGNTVRGQSTTPFSIYTDPFKAGNPIKIIGNTYEQSSQPFFQWLWGYYAGLSVSYRPTENLATMLAVDNIVRNVSTGSNPVFGLTGRASILNNTFQNVAGWAIKVDYTTKVPTLSSTNRLLNVTNGYWVAPISTGGTFQTTTLANLTIIVTNTALRWENGNLILQNADFGAATTPIVMVNGHADIYSSNLPVLSASVSAGGSVSVYNLVGFSVTWANAAGVDSTYAVSNAALVVSSSAHKIITSGRADAQGKVPARMLLVWEQFSFGSSYEGRVYAPFEILVSSQGVSETVKLPNLGPGEIPRVFQDYADHPVLLRDTLVPTISVGTPTAGSTLGSVTIPIEGHSFERGSGIGVQRVKMDAAGTWIDIANTGTATWQLTLMVDTEGSHTIFGEVTDRAGNWYGIQVPFSVDITPPTLEITDPLVDRINTRESTYIVQGHVEPASSEVDINGFAVPVLGRGEFATEFTLLDGLNVLFITAEDGAGNEVTVVREVYFDQYSPFIQVTKPVDGLKTSESVIDVEGRAEPGSTVTVNGIPAVASPVDGSFIIRNFVLADLYDQTENLLLIRAADQVGNFAWDNRSVTVDIRAPTITLELDPAVAQRIASGQPVAASSVDIRGKTDSSDATVAIGGQEVTLNGLTFSRVIVLAEGRNAVEITAEDEVGNVKRITLVIMRDTAKPSLTIDRPAEPTVLTNQRTLEIRGSTDAPGSTVYLEYNNSVGAPVQDALPAVPVGYPVSYRFERLLDLVSDGNVHIVTVRVVDAAGNEAVDHIAYTSKVTPPQVALLNLAETVTDTFVWVNGSTEEGIDKVRINGQTFDVTAQYFSVRWNLPVTTGDYTFRVSVVDAAGNVGQTEATVHVNVARPGGTVNTAPAGISPELLTGAMLGLLGVSLAVVFVGYMLRGRKDQ